jgi:hypothetical protein
MAKAVMPSATATTGSKAVIAASAASGGRPSRQGT